MNILSEKDNPLFNRKELQIQIEADVTPTRQEVKKLLSEKFSSPKETIAIKKIVGNFGSRVFTVIANVYDSKENKEQTELNLKRDKDEEPVAEQPAETKEEEKPAEEIKQEEKTEEIKAEGEKE